MKHNSGQPPHRKDRPEPPREPSGPPELPAGLPEEAAAAKAEKRLAAKTDECRQLIDQLQRLAAEYSNYQKRIERHLQDEKRLAVRGLVLDLLPAVDNLERALAHAMEQPDLAVFQEGVTLAYNGLMAALKNHGVTPIETEGQTFDPEHHEAITLVPSEEHPKGHVVEVMQKGYRLHGQTIRPSRVAVSDGAEAEKTDEPDGPPAEDEKDGGEPQP